MADLGSGRGHVRREWNCHDEPSQPGTERIIAHHQHGSLPRLLVAKSKNIPVHVRVDPPEGGLKTQSIILCDQLRTISKDRLGQAPWGKVSAMTLAEVEKALRMLLGL
jgi:mRNA-degrading endonuclease toxin of MazEF toxin-antitoxin module